MGKQELAVMIPVLAVFFGGIVILSKTIIGQAIARRIGGHGWSETEHRRLEELEEEMGQLRQELVEAHERIDFTERLLASGRREAEADRPGA